MHTRYLSLALACGAVATILAGARPAGAAVDAQTPDRVMKVLRDYVAANPDHQLVGVGSWIRGGYRPGFSDHDIRLLVPAGTGDDAARAAWGAARRDIIQRLTREFQADGVQVVEQILKKTNLYSPQQLMSAASDLEDATRIFRGLGQVPNLGFPHAVNQSTPLKYFEGLYGEGRCPTSSLRNWVRAGSSTARATASSRGVWISHTWPRGMGATP